jgi:hypothetical protein
MMLMQLWLGWLAFGLLVVPLFCLQSRNSNQISVFGIFVVPWLFAAVPLGIVSVGRLLALALT